MLKLSGPRIVTQIHGWNTHDLLFSCVWCLLAQDMHIFLLVKRRHLQGIYNSSKHNMKSKILWFEKFLANDSHLYPDMILDDQNSQQKKKKCFCLLFTPTVYTNPPMTNTCTESYPELTLCNNSTEARSFIFILFFLSLWKAIHWNEAKLGSAFPFFFVLLRLHYLVMGTWCFKTTATTCKNWNSFCSLHILTSKIAFNKGESLLTGSEKRELAGALETSSDNS